MIIYNYPALLSAVTVSMYWLIVFVKAIRITPKIGKTPNVIPKELVGLLSRLIMAPLIVVWITIPWQVAFSLSSNVNATLAWIGATLCTVALMVTIYCWYHMGTSWRIGIDPNEKNRLIMDGPFKHIRHPIYALSMLLMGGCFLATQTQSMFMALCVHWILFTFETYREEKHLTQVYGKSYRTYVASTNRFLPPLR